MNTFKIITVSLYLLFTSSSIVFSQTVEYGGKFYSFPAFETPGLDKNDPKKDSIHSLIIEKFHQLRREGVVHPVSWEDEILKVLPDRVDLELMCIIGGDLKAINKDVKDLGGTTWLYKNIDWNTVRLEVKLLYDGSGLVTLYDKQGCVGMFRCHSSAIQDVRKENCQPLGEYTFEGKPGLRNHVNHEGVLMENARRFDPDRGLFIHLGQITAPSHGCLRVSEWWSNTIFDMVPKGAKIKVSWLQKKK